MRLARGRGVLVASLFLLIVGNAFGEYEVGISVPNWSVPPYRSSGASSGLSPMADISPGVAFVAVSPCRVFDTRGANGPYGGPRLLANTTRNFDIDSGPCTGIPTGVDAYSMNFGAILPDGANSFVTIWPTGTAQPLVSSINPIQGGVVANAAIVPAGTGGSISVFPNTGLHLYGDINGYFTDSLNAGNQFLVNASVPAGAAIFGVNSSGVELSAGVRGDSSLATGRTFGVWGQTASTTSLGAGVVGVAAAASGLSIGTWGQTASNTDGAIGVYGDTLSTTGRNYGVWGQSRGGCCGAGVLGVDGSGVTAYAGALLIAGVRGESNSNVGVLGVTGPSGFHGVRGSIVSGPEGFLGSHIGGNVYGVYSGGNYGGTGAKFFVEPHPNDASKVIRYVSLEGPESGTYFRGRGKFQNGIAMIDVPEDFRMVTDPEGLSVVATPIGAMATISVASVGLDRIVLRGSRNVEFFYIVNGVRKTHKHLTPIGPGHEYMPETPDAKMPVYLTEGQKEMLISNGTYNREGTVNMETARRLGWDKEWEKRGHPAPRPSD